MSVAFNVAVRLVIMMQYVDMMNMILSVKKSMNVSSRFVIALETGELFQFDNLPTVVDVQLRLPMIQ